MDGLTERGAIMTRMMVVSLLEEVVIVVEVVLFAGDIVGIEL